MPTTQPKYDPMQDFWKRGIDFLFKQSPVIVLAVVGLYLFWQKLERMEVQRVSDRIEVRQECANAITEIRADLEHCQHRNELLTLENKNVSAEVAALKVMVSRWSRKMAVSYGVNN